MSGGLHWHHSGWSKQFVEHISFIEFVQDLKGDKILKLLVHKILAGFERGQNHINFTFVTSTFCRV